MKRSARLTILVLSFAALASLGGWFALTRNAGPDEAAGRAWLDGFADLVTSSRLLGGRGPAALALFPQLGSWPGNECQTTFRKTGGLGPIIVSQSLDLARQEPTPCDQAQFGHLITVLRQSEGVTPGALVDRFTQQFGAPQLHRDASLSGSVIYDWDILYGVNIHMDEPVQPGGADRFSVVITRFLGASAAIPTIAEGERWLDQTVSLLTGPDLLAARGMQAIRLVDADLKPDPVLGDGCANSFSTSSATVRQSIAYDKSLTLDGSAPDCQNGAFALLWLSVWQRDPVTVQNFVERLQARLGQPALSRDFSQHRLQYDWTTSAGAKISVIEDIGSIERDFIIHFSRN